MFIVEALHPEGWVYSATFELEYWAIQNAQLRSRSDGRHYRILDAASQQIVCVLDSGSCGAMHSGTAEISLRR